MKKLLLCFAIFTIFALQTQAKTIRTFAPLVSSESVPDFQTMNPLDLDNQIENTITENYPKITELELHLFNKSYENENIYSRLTRLENKIFGASFKGHSLSNRVDNLFRNVDEGIFYGIKNKDLLKLETRVLGRTYTNDDTETRITRLEKEMLGAMQSGNLKTRYETVKLAAKHYNTYPEIVQNSRYYSGQTPVYSPNQVYNQNTGMGLGTIMNNLLGRVFGDFGQGVITGYTPSIYESYNQNSPYYGNYPYYGPAPDTGFQEYNIGTNGGYYRNKNYSGGTGVHILN